MRYRRGVPFAVLLAFVGTSWAVPAPSSNVLQARPGFVYSFPRDHGSHERYGLEWWYVTGHVYDRSARRFGYEVTFFRKTVDDPRVRRHPSRWALRQVYAAHFALTDVTEGAFHFSEKISRAAFGKAGASPDRLRVWIDRWALESATEDHQRLHLTARDARAPGHGVDLVLTLRKPPVIHGQDGISRKGAAPGQASHYYSLTRLATQGAIWAQGKRFDVTGTSWLDHEFGSGEAGERHVGWDWLSVQFDSEMELMMYLLRNDDGSHDPASSGTLIFPDATTLHLTRDDVIVRALKHWTSPASHARYPAQWLVEVPSVQLRVTLTPVLADQELRTDHSTRVTYWEGAVRVEGRYRLAPIAGNGYVELVGYATPGAAGE